MVLSNARYLHQDLRVKAGIETHGSQIRRQHLRVVHSRRMPPLKSAQAQHYSFIYCYLTRMAAGASPARSAPLASSSSPRSLIDVSLLTGVGSMAAWHLRALLSVRAAPCLQHVERVDVVESGRVWAAGARSAAGP